VVQGDHPQAAEIQDALAESPDLAQRLQQVSADIQLVEAAQRARQSTSLADPLVTSAAQDALLFRYAAYGLAPVRDER